VRPRGAGAGGDHAEMPPLEVIAQTSVPERAVATSQQPPHPLIATPLRRAPRALGLPLVLGGDRGRETLKERSQQIQLVPPHAQPLHHHHPRITDRPTTIRQFDKLFLSIGLMPGRRLFPKGRPGIGL